MAGTWIIVAVLTCFVVLVAALVGIRVRTLYRQAAQTRARKAFRRRREHLEAKFFDLAAASGKPRGLRWVNCEFDDQIAYARDRQTGDLIAFVGVAISFEAIAGGPMEDVAAVGEVRAATAVFQYADENWRTDGRAIFNLNPAEALDRFQSSLETVLDDPRPKTHRV